MRKKFNIIRVQTNTPVVVDTEEERILKEKIASIQAKLKAIDEEPVHVNTAEDEKQCPKPLVTIQKKVPPNPTNNKLYKTGNYEKKSGEYIPKAVWEREIFKIMETRVGGEVCPVPESDRIDVHGDDYRMVIMQLYGGEFEITLYVKHGIFVNTTQLIINWIPMDKLAVAIHNLLNIYKQFK